MNQQSRETYSKAEMAQQFFDAHPDIRDALDDETKFNDNDSIILYENCVSEKELVISKHDHELNERYFSFSFLFIYY